MAADCRAGRRSIPLSLIPKVCDYSGAGTARVRRVPRAGRLRHLAFAGAWKQGEPLWDVVIRAKRVGAVRPALEKVLAGGRRKEGLARGSLGAAQNAAHSG